MATNDIRKNCKCDNLKKVTHIIFDLDGTLLNSEVHYNEAIKQTCEYYEKKYTINEEMKVLGRSSVEGARVLIDCLGIPATVDEYLNKYHAIAHSMIQNSELMPGAKELVTHFHRHKIPMAIATSSIPEGFEIKMQRHKDFLKVFHHYVLTVDPEVKNGKPFPDIFLTACRRFEEKPKPQDCLVFEDSPSGIRAAKAAKMQCVMIPDKKVPEELKTLATMVIESFEDFKPELFGLPPIDK